jgi:hypothetical protein
MQSLPAALPTVRWPSALAGQSSPVVACGTVLHLVRMVIIADASLVSCLDVANGKLWVAGPGFAVAGELEKILKADAKAPGALVDWLALGLSSGMVSQSSRQLAIAMLTKSMRHVYASQTYRNAQGRYAPHMFRDVRGGVLGGKPLWFPERCGHSSENCGPAVNRLYAPVTFHCNVQLAQYWHALLCL